LSFYHDWIDFNINGINPVTVEPNKTTTVEPSKTTTDEPNKTITGEPNKTTTGEPNRTTTVEPDKMTTTPCTGECPPGDHGAANMIQTNVFLGLIFHLFFLFALLH